MQGLWYTLRAAIMWLDCHAEWLLVGGLIAAVAVNWLQWRKDKRAAQRLEGQPTEPPVLNKAPRVSILLPAWNEAAHLAACLDSILALRYPNKEVVVCAGGQDGTLEIARRYAGQRVIVLEQAPGEGKQRALRRCFQQAKGDIIFLTDADCLLDDQNFESTLAPLIHDQEDATTGTWRPLERQAAHLFVQFQWIHHLYREVWMPDYALTLDGRNAAVRCQALEAAGAFRSEVPIGTDYVLSKQLTTSGYRIRFVRGSRVQTEYPQTMWAYWKQQSRWFRTPLILGIQWRDWSLVLTVLRAGLAAVFMLGVPLTGGLGCRLLWYPWLAALTHLSLAQLRLIGFARLAGQEPVAPRWRYLLFFPYMVIGWIGMARGLLESLLPSRRGKW